MVEKVNEVNVGRQNELNGFWYITNKITRSCIFGKRLKHVCMLKTVKSNIFRPML